MFWNKKKKVKSQESKIILGMIMLEEEKTFELDNFIEDFKNNYGYDIQKTEDDATLVFEVNGEMVAIAHMPVPIPINDLKESAQYAYYWQTAFKEVQNHKSHIIVSILQGGNNQINRYKLFTQVLSSLLRITNSIGVYKGNQSLLIQKDDYLRQAEHMNEGYLPLNLWVYFGLRSNDEGNSAYTYGLQEFNKNELEILHSSKDLEAIRGFIFNIAHYVLSHNITFKNGETIGDTEEEKIEITFSKGYYIETDTFKLAY